MHTATKSVLDALKTASKKVVHIIAEAIKEFIGNKISDNIVKPKSLSAMNSRNVEETDIPPKKREEILNKLTQVYKNGTL